MTKLEVDPDYSFVKDCIEPESSQAFLRTRGDHWQINYSPLTDYSRRANIYGYEAGLLDVFAANIRLDEGVNIGLDIAAGTNARALRDLIDSKVIARGLATNYEDLRPKQMINDPRVSHIDGNLTDEATWRKIVEWQQTMASDGFAVAMHRPMGGLQYLEPEYYVGAAKIVLDMVRPGGVLFTQIPRRLASDDSALNEACASITERTDVRKIIKSQPQESNSKDESDLYAVILKHR